MTSTGKPRRAVAAAMSLLLLLGITACTDAPDQYAPPPRGKPLWQGQLSSKNVRIAATEGHLFIQQPEGLGIVNLAGAPESWSLHPLHGGDLEGSDKPSLAYLAGDDAVVTWAVYGTKSVNVYDTATGELRFSHPEPDIVSLAAVAATNDTLILAERRYESHVSKVRLIARDLRSGAEKWRRELGPQYGEVQLTVPAPNRPYNSNNSPYGYAVALASASPVVFLDVGTNTNSAGAVHAVDVTTGKDRWSYRTKPGLQERSFFELLEDGDILITDVADDNDDCKLTVTLADPAADTSVQHEYPLHAIPCPAVEPLQLHRTQLFTSDARSLPQVLDLTTGKPFWTATEEARPVAYYNGIAFVVSERDGAKDVLQAVDVATGGELWTAIGSGVTSGTAFLDDTQLITTSAVSGASAAYTSTVHDARTGADNWQANGMAYTVSNAHYVLVDGTTVAVYPHDGGL